MTKLRTLENIDNMADDDYVFEKGGKKMSYVEIIKIEMLSGTNIEDACSEARTLALKRNAIVNFNFNGVNMVVHGWSLEQDLIGEYYKKVTSSSAQSDNSQKNSIE